VIRRGPSKQVATILWDRRDDSFTLGQWLKGRIYEQRCDLSPDGKHLLYFAMNGKWESETGGSWTALSRAPYLKAIGLWGKGDCWHGGGLFTSNDAYWINDGYGHTELTVPKDFARAGDYPRQNEFGGECPGVYFLRLMRDGWTLRPKGWLMSLQRRKARDCFEKRLLYDWTLEKIDDPAASYVRPGKGVYSYTHRLTHPTTETILTDWQWADWDATSSRLVWASEGKLFAAQLCREGFVDKTELYDFNPMKFEAIEAQY